MALPIPYQVQPNTIYAWDANTLTATMKACGMRVHTVVTSPPYFGLRDYGADGQIGLEPTPDEYVRALVTVFRGVRDVLRDDGTLWLNLGDSYANDDKWGGATGGKHAGGLHGNTNVGRGKKATGIAPKNLIGIPWRVAFALQADGWILRSDIIWSKPNPMPESVTDRLTKAHEYLFLFAKSARYYYDAAAIAEPMLTDDTSSPRGSYGVLGPQNKGRRLTGGGFSKRYADAQINHGGESNRRVYTTRNKRSVWTVNTEPSPIPHFAMYPQKLIEPCILAGAPAGGIVFDPFMGGGTTALVAQRLGRQYIGSEINPENVEIARYRVSGRIDEYLAKKRGEAFTAYMFEEQTA